MKIWPIQTWDLPLDRGHMELVRFGRGRKPLVLIPGLSLKSVRQAALPLAWLYRLFAKEYTVYVFDKPSVLPAVPTVRQLAGSLAQAMEQLGLNKADVLGISLGGMMAQALALDHPALVNKLALAVTACRPNPTIEQAVTGWTALVRQGDYQALWLDILEKMYSPARLRKYRPWLPLLAKLGKPRDPARFAALAQACLSWDACQQLSRIRCPVLVFGGGQDRVVSAAASAELAQALGCGLVFYRQLGHAAYEEAPDFNRRVLDFFRAAGSPPQAGSPG